MSRTPYYSRNANRPKPLLEKVADDLPQGYPKAALDLINGVGSKNVWWVLGGAAVATLLYLNRNKS